MKKYLICKTDENRIIQINKCIEKINPKNIYVFCENNRAYIYSSLNATILPLKELNKNNNWIDFCNNFTSESLLIIDNVLKFVFFGDGKKKYLKDVSQSFKNVIVTDSMPFFTEPHEMFFPFWFLGKDILGFNSYHSFKGNHFEEKNDGSISTSHSFDVIYEKIKDYYYQDYSNLFENNKDVFFEMTDVEVENYNDRKEKEASNFSNPIKMFNACSENINLIESRFKAVNKELNNTDFKKACVVINAGGIYPKMYLKRINKKNVDILTIHTDIDKFKDYDFVILAEMPIVKPYNWLYIQASLKCDISILRLKNNNLEDYFYNKIFNNELRKQFGNSFCSENV